MSLNQKWNFLLDIIYGVKAFDFNESILFLVLLYWDSLVHRFLLIEKQYDEKPWSILMSRHLHPTVVLIWFSFSLSSMLFFDTVGVFNVLILKNFYVQIRMLCLDHYFGTKKLKKRNCFTIIVIILNKNHNVHQNTEVRIINHLLFSSKTHNTQTSTLLIQTTYFCWLLNCSWCLKQI